LLRKNFKNVEKIFWKRAHGKNTVKNKPGAVIDIIYRAFNGQPKFVMQFVPLDEKYFNNSYKNHDGKDYYALGSLKHDKTRKGYDYRIIRAGKTYSAPYGWKIKKSNMDKLIKDNRIHFVDKPVNSGDGILYKKLYKSECKGKPFSNLWDDISYITRSTKDPRFYPTQKPLKLLERIILMSSNPGDYILDPVAGSGDYGDSRSKAWTQGYIN
jgi:DNA modification methylase